MAIDSAIVAAAKKEYKDFEKDINTEVESKMKKYLSGFQQHLEKNAFNKEG